MPNFNPLTSSYNSYDVSLENLVLGKLVIPKLIFSFILSLSFLIY